jgi:hypothetical protein
MTERGQTIKVALECSAVDLTGVGTTPVPFGSLTIKEMICISFEYVTINEGEILD